MGKLMQGESGLEGSPLPLRVQRLVDRGLRYLEPERRASGNLGREFEGRGLQLLTRDDSVHQAVPQRFLAVATPTPNPAARSANVSPLRR